MLPFLWWNTSLATRNAGSAIILLEFNQNVIWTLCAIFFLQRFYIAGHENMSVMIMHSDTSHDIQFMKSNMKWFMVLRCLTVGISWEYHNCILCHIDCNLIFIVLTLTSFICRPRAYNYNDQCITHEMTHLCNKTHGPASVLKDVLKCCVSRPTDLMTEIYWFLPREAPCGNCRLWQYNMYKITQVKLGNRLVSNFNYKFEEVYIISRLLW